MDKENEVYKFPYLRQASLSIGVCVINGMNQTPNDYWPSAASAGLPHWLKISEDQTYSGEWSQLHYLGHDTIILWAAPGIQCIPDCPFPLSLQKDLHLSAHSLNHSNTHFRFQLQLICLLGDPYTHPPWLPLDAKINRNNGILFYGHLSSREPGKGTHNLNISLK